jgi:hypothetical protein
MKEKREQELISKRESRTKEIIFTSPHNRHENAGGK